MTSPDGTLAAGRGGRRRGHPGRASSCRSSSSSSASAAARPSRRDRRSLGRPLARMGDAFAAASLQLCGAARRRRRGGLLDMKQRARQQARRGRRARYEEIEMPRNSPTGFVCAFFATVDGLRADLAHLVAGRRWRRSAPTRPSSSSPGATRTKTSSRPTTSRASTAPTEARAARRSRRRRRAP